MKYPAIVVFAIICLFGFSKPGKASNLVLNGSFESTTLSSPGGYFCQAGSTCTSNVTDWASSCNFSSCGNGNTVLSLLFAGTNRPRLSMAESACGVPLPTARTAVTSWQTTAISTYGAAISQTINGLVTGDTYSLSFYQAAAQQSGSNGPTTERWQVSLGSDTQLSTLMTNPSHGFQSWNQQTMTFTATSTSEVLTFLAVGTPSGVPPVSLLDGVSLISTSVPEPGAIYVTALGLGLLGLCAIRTQRKRRI